MEKILSLKLQSVIDELRSVVDNQEKLKTSKQVSRQFELYNEEHAKSPFLEFSLGEDLYAILNAEEEHFYTVERTYSQGKETEREVDDETMNELLSEIFGNGDYVINTYHRVYDGGGSISDPYSANYHYDTGEVSGVPLTTVGYKSKSDIEYDKIRKTVEKAKAVLRELKENNGILVSDEKQTSTAPRNFDEAVQKIYPMGTYKLSFSLLNDLSDDIKVVLNPTDNTYSVSTYSFGQFEKGIDDPEINEILEQIFTDGQYSISTFSKKADYTNADKVIKGKAFEEISHKAIRPVFGKEQSEEEKVEEQRETIKPEVQAKTEQVKPRMTPYQVIAKNALMNWNGLSEEEATKKVQESTFEELESQVYAEGSITYALEGLQIAAKKAHDKLSRAVGGRVDSEPVINDYRIEELKEIVLHGGKSKEEEDKIYAEIKESLMLDMPDIWTREDMALTVLSHIHDGWVKDNQKKFMARDKKYQHMPIELIGWKEAKADLLFLQPILSAMKAGYMESLLESAYDERVKEFFRTRGIKDISQLQGQILKGASFYPALKGQDDILQALQDPQFVAEEVIPSIQEKGVGADENAMKRVEQWKMRSSKLATAKARKKELQKEAKIIGEAEKLIEEKENNGQSLE